MTQNDKIRIHLRVNGRVQGVGFRWFVASEARRLGLPGWVRNNPDGSVELEAEGPADRIDVLRKRVGKGPPASRVESVVELEVSADELRGKFETRR